MHGLDIEFVGRAAELETLSELLDTARAGAGRVVDLVGEPGIGKTRLSRKWSRRNDDITVLRANGGLYSRAHARTSRSRPCCASTPASTDRPAAPWPDGCCRWVLDAAPELGRWLPLLAIAFGAEVPMTQAVENIDPANRAGKLREVVVDVLTATLAGPGVIIVDDAHLLDEASEELFAAVGRRIGTDPGC